MTPPDATWRRVLLVDDDPDVAAIVALALGQVPGCAVSVCAASRDAVARARALRPDLILLDVMMPVLDGEATLRALRAEPDTASIPVVFISAGVDARDAPSYRALGAAGVVPKPFDPVRLPATLAAILRGESADPAYPRLPAALRADYAAELRGTLSEMARLAAGLAAEGWDRPATRVLADMAHRVAGSSGLFGLPAVSQAAKVLDAMLKRALEGEWPPPRPATDLVILVKALAKGAPGRSSTRSSTRRGSGRATGSP